MPWYLRTLVEPRIPGGCKHGGGEALPELPQGPDVEMVIMIVAKEDDIDRR